ncbi:MAG: DUF6049 family protein [Candidatus Geothermincolia bacterium]
MLEISKSSAACARRPGHRTATRLGAALVILALVLLACPAVFAAPPEKQPEDIKIAFSKNALWYEPGAQVKLKVTLDNRTDQAIKGVDVRFRIHARNTSRAELDNAFEGTPVETYRQTETLARDLTLEPGNSGFAFEFKLTSGRFTDGVYPVTLEALKGGSRASAVVGEMVIFSTEENTKITPLRVSIVFDTLEPPHRGPDGLFEGDELAAECDPSGRNPGWYSTLLDTVEKSQNLNASFSLSPMLLDEIRDMTDGYSVKIGDVVQHRDKDSKQSINASSTLSSFRRLAQTQHDQVLPAPFSSPNLETLIGLRWVSDARQQMASGHKALETDLDMALGGEFFCPPGLAMNSKVISDLGAAVGQFLMISDEALQRSKEGKRLARGNTLSQPTQVAGTKDGRQTLALFEDARLRRLFGLISGSGDAHGVAQVILAELTNLYLEQPEKARTCAVLWPAQWRPSREVLEEVVRALTTAPWIKTATFAESMMTVPALDNDPLEIPQPTDQSGDYFAQVGRARQRFSSFSTMVLKDNPLLPILETNLAVSESDVWREWDRRVEGLSYASAVIRTIDNEVDKVDMPAMGSITLTSGSAKIPLSIINGTSYRISATLRLASNGLTFPDGTVQKVRLEPKENVLEIRVKVKKKGRVRFQARLEASNFILGEVDFTVLTSRFNTFAIVVVGGLLALIGGIWIFKASSRRKAGKHKRRNLPGDEEEPEGQGSEA